MWYIYYLEKLTFSKLQFLSERKFEKQKGTRYLRGNVCFSITVFSCLSSTKPCLRFLLICFVREIKGFYQSSLENEVDFRDITNIPPQKKKKKNLKKQRHGFVDERALITTMFLSLENPSTLLVAKEKTWKSIFNTNSELSQSCTENFKLCHPKQQ